MPQREQPLRIVYHLNSVTMGGMEHHSAQLACAMTRMGSEVYAIVPEDEVLAPLVDQLKRCGVTVCRLDINGDLPTRQLFGNWLQMWRWLRKWRVNIFHQQRTGPYHGKWACLAAYSAGIPVILATEHNYSYHLKGVARWLSWMADHLVQQFIVVSNADRHRQIRLSDRPAWKIITIHNGVHLAPFIGRDPGSARAQRRVLGIERRSPTIGTVARLTPDKGIDVLLEAASHLVKTWPDLRLLIIGDGPERQQYERTTAALGIGRQVHFLGYQNDIAGWFGLLDIFVLPSIIESFGLTLVEAMAASLPVVATRVGGIPEVVADGETGLLVPAKNPAALAEAVGRYLNDADLRQAHAKAGQCRAMSLFSDSVMTGKVLSLYSSLWEARGNR